MGEKTRRVKKEAPGKEASSRIKAGGKPKVNIVTAKALTVPTYSYQPTSNPDLFRYVDQAGDWQFYYVKSKNVYLPAVNRILTYGVAKGRGFYNYLLSKTKDEAERILKAAGERGVRVHDAIRQMLMTGELKMDDTFKNDITGKFEKLTHDEWRFMVAFVKWCGDWKPETLAVEDSRYDLNLGVAGTIDFVGTINRNGGRVFVLIDFKTSAQIYDDYKLQVAAYSELWKGVPVEATGVVRLKLARVDSKQPYEMRLWHAGETARHLEAFKSAKNLHDLVTDAKNHDPSKELEEVPTVLKVRVPKIKQTKKSKPKAKK